MFIPKNHKITRRCPVCFNREIDVLMRYTNSKYFCLKCSFNGTEAQVRDAYKDTKKKFSLIRERVNIETYENI